MDGSFEQLWQKFARDLRGFLRARVSDHATAEDLLQEIFVRLHQHLPELRDQDRLEAWVYQIARNTVTDFHRRQRPTETIDALADAVIEPETVLPNLRPAVRRFVEQLPPDFRDALLATEWEGLTQAEYATRRGLSISGAKSRVQRARIELKRLLEECCSFELDRRGQIIEATPRRSTIRIGQTLLATECDSACPC